MWLNLDALESALNTRTLGRRLVYLTSTTSTMDVARREAEADAPEGTVVIAEEQTAGRGRFGRAWASPAGKNLYLTVLLRPPIDRLRLLSMAAPLAVAQAVQATTGLEPSIKWPNDVLLDGRKLSGALIENELSGGAVRYALIGIGVNVNFDVASTPEIAAIATSVQAALGRPISREQLLAALLNQLEALYESDREAIYAAWRARLDTLGREITVSLSGEHFTGVAENVDEQGNLLLRLPDGSLLTFEAGEVTLRV